LEKNKIGLEVDATNRVRPCAIVPPGHLVAEGWLRVQADGVRPVVPVCQILPPGIQAQVSGTAGVDFNAPVMVQINFGTITSSSARVTWKTNESAMGKVWYSTVSPVVAGSASVASENRFTTDHDITLSGLSANTTYYFLVESSDVAGNKSFSTQASFTTTAVTPDVTMPIVTNISASVTSNTSATITWNTNESATTKVWYQANSSAVVGSSLSATADGLSTSHRVSLTGLAPNTTYFYVVESTDAAGNRSVSAQFSFTTLP
jgi:phosphodiesterase/alkaline phosphatase D-like protein